MSADSTIISIAVREGEEERGCILPEGRPEGNDSEFPAFDPELARTWCLESAGIKEKV